MDGSQHQVYEGWQLRAEQFSRWWQPRAMGAMDASLWIRVPGAMYSIDATMQAYEFMREVREKHLHKARSAQEAAVVLRDVLVLVDDRFM